MLNLCKLSILAVFLASFAHASASIDGNEELRQRMALMPEVDYALAQQDVTSSNVKRHVANVLRAIHEDNTFFLAGLNGNEDLDANEIKLIVAELNGLGDAALMIVKANLGSVYSEKSGQVRKIYDALR